MWFTITEGFYLHQTLRINKAKQNQAFCDFSVLWRQK